MNNFFATLRERLANNVVEPVQEMNTQNWIRFTVIICGYLLLRPYLVKIGATQSMKGYEAASADGSEKKKTKTKKGTKMTDPNDLRNMVDIPEDTDSEEEEEETKSGNVKASEWGTKARRRQRRVVKQILEAEEKRIQNMLGDDEDKDIADLLED